MSWNDFYKRRDAIDAVLALAARRRSGKLPYHELPQVRDVFASEDELLRALQYKWQRTLTAQIDLAVAEADDDPRIDRFDVVSRAWKTATRREPALRRILDEHADHPAIREQVASERRQLAHVAGLTSAGDTDEDVTALGDTFLALVRAGQRAARPNKRPSLLRKLVGAASA